MQNNVNNGSNPSNMGPSINSVNGSMGVGTNNNVEDSVPAPQPVQVSNINPVNGQGGAMSSQPNYNMNQNMGQMGNVNPNMQMMGGRPNPNMMGPGPRPNGNMGMYQGMNGQGMMNPNMGQNPNYGPMPNQPMNSGVPFEEEEPSKGKSFVTYLLVFLVLVGAAVGGYFGGRWLYHIINDSTAYIEVVDNGEFFM